MILFRRILLIILLIIIFAPPARVLAQSTSPELFLVAQKAFEDGFYDVAIRYIEQLQKEDPNNEKAIEANLLLGQCYFFKSHYLKAYDVFNELLNENKHKDITLFWLGETYLKGADYKQAETHYKQLLDLYPESTYVPQTMYSMGWVAFEQEKYEEARKTFALLTKRFKDHPLSEDSAFKVGECDYHTQDYEKAIEYFKKYTQDYPKSNRQAEASFYIAEAYYYLNDPLNAVTYYAQAANVSYDQKLVLMSKVSLGWSYLKLERYKLAQQYFTEAGEYAKEKGILSDDVFLGQANLYTATEEYAKALEAYKQLILNFPDSKRISESLLGKANIHYKLNQYTEAIEAYQKVIELVKEDPTSQDVFEKAYFGMAWSQLKSGAIDKAVESFESIKGLTKNTTVKISALTQIGDAYQDTNDYEKAVAIYDEILLTYPDSLYIDYVQYRQGIALLKMGKLDAAKLSFQSLTTNYPNSKYINDINYYLAVSYYQNGNWSLAHNHIEEFIKVSVNRHEFLSDAHTILGLSLFYLKEYDGALEVFKKMLKNFPTDGNAVRTAELNVAKCYYEKGEVPEALKRFKLVAEKYAGDPNSQEALIWLGDHYLKNGEFNSAIAYYNQFMELYPGSDQHALVLYELGQAYEGLEQYEHAINTFKRITQEGNREMFVKAKLAIADIFSRELDSSSAIQTYQNIIESSPEFKRDAYVKIAQVYKDDKKFKDAIVAYKTAIGSDMELSLYADPQLYFELADTYELSKSVDQAIESYLKIGYLFPAETAWIVKSYLRMGRMFEDQEDWSQATIAYQKINEYDTQERKFAQERLEWIKKNIQ